MRLSCGICVFVREIRPQVLLCEIPRYEPISVRLRAIGRELKPWAGS